MQLPTEYQTFIALSRYARWLENEKRRESWSESVGRYIAYFKDEHLPDFLNGQELPEQAYKEIDRLHQAKLDTEVMGSMRALMTAGKALGRDHVAAFNCSYMPIEHPRCFDEMLYILMCGTGVGYAVERQMVKKLPEVEENFEKTDTVIHVQDSKRGWAKALRELISLLYSGQIPQWDLSKIRPAGAKLKTFGGRASGPDPLNNLFNFCVSLFQDAAGRKLTSLECHDLCCKIADIVVVGGVRRSALICLSNLSDDRMRRAKTGDWLSYHKHRRLANISATYDTNHPEFETFLGEWVNLYESKSGERGIFNRQACVKQASKNGRRDPNQEWGTNPCSEIILRPYQMCNLSEVVVRPDDDLVTLKDKVHLATIAGTLQSTLTDFRYLRKIWKDQCEEERLLGVSLTGIMDHPKMSNPDDPELPQWLDALREQAVATNAEWSKMLGINQSAAITCIKPSGTVSQLVDSASGIHPRYSQYYYRNVRADVKDPLAQMMKEQGFPWEVDQMNSDNVVFTFPQKAPDTARMESDVGPINQLKLWKVYQDHWCEHKPSMTCYYTDDTFLGVGQWIWENFDTISGISFMPYDGGVYPQAPFVPIGEEEYNRMCEIMPTPDWSKLGEYEDDDNTTTGHEFACTAGSCEIVDLTK